PAGDRRAVGRRIGRRASGGRAGAYAAGFGRVRGGPDQSPVGPRLAGAVPCRGRLGSDNRPRAAGAVRRGFGPGVLLEALGPLWRCGRTEQRAWPCAQRADRPLVRGRQGAGCSLDSLP
ncbi:hypothetical protein LCGC14_3053550, partial [marine sediment metagenome]